MGSLLASASDYRAENITFMICIAVVLTALILGIFFGRNQPCNCEDDDDDVSDSA